MNIIFKQMLKFVGISGIGWILDLFTFYILGIWSQHYFANNVISSFLGLTLVFSVSTRYVFSSRKRLSVQSKYIIYLAYQIALIVIVSKTLLVLNDLITALNLLSTLSGSSHILAKILVTPMTLICNFVVMKCITEKL